MGTQGGGPPNKWTSFNVEGLSSAAVLIQLNALAAQGYTGAAVYVPCSDGNFVFVGGYSEQ